MSYNSKSIKRDADGRAVPQYFNKDTDDFEVVQGSDGSLLTQRANIFLEQTILAGVTAPTTGSVVSLKGHYMELVVEVYGTATSCSYDFKWIPADGVASSDTTKGQPMFGICLNNLEVASTGTGVSKTWTMDVTGLDSIFVDLTAVSDGNVTVRIRAFK